MSRLQDIYYRKQIIEKFKTFLNENQQRFTDNTKAEFNVFLNNMQKYHVVYSSDAMQNYFKLLDNKLNEIKNNPEIIHSPRSMLGLQIILQKININCFYIISSVLTTDNHIMSQYLQNQWKKISETIEQYEQQDFFEYNKYRLNKCYNTIIQTCNQVIEQAVKQPDIDKHHHNLFVNLIRSFLELFNCNNLLKSFDNNFPTKERIFVNETYTLFNGNENLSDNNYVVKESILKSPEMVPNAII